MMRLVPGAIAALCAAGWLAPSVATACGPTPTPYVTLAEVLPATRTGVARDGAVVVRGKLWGPSGGPFPFAQVRLLDQAGAEIPAVQVSWYSGPDSLAFRPAIPLAARTRFSVEAVVPEGPVRPPGAEGPLSVRLDFETGDGVAAPLRLAGPLRVTLERFEVPAVTCQEPPQGCAVMNGCQKQPARRAIRARVVVPAAEGGVDFDGYRGWLRFTDHLPAVFDGDGEGRRGGPGDVNLMSWLAVQPGEEAVILQEIVEESAPYAPCFALNLWDPAGHAVQAEPVCLPVVDLSHPLPGEQMAGGCSFSPASRAGSGLSLLLLAGVAVLLTRSKNREGRILLS